MRVKVLQGWAWVGGQGREPRGRAAEAAMGRCTGCWVGHLSLPGTVSGLHARRGPGGVSGAEKEGNGVA